MKRIVIIFLMLFLLTGCGNKIICKTIKSDVSEVYKIKYNDNIITNIEIIKTYKFKDKSEFKNYEPMMQYTVKSNTDDNVKSSYKKKYKKYILKQVYDIGNIDDDDLLKYGLSKNKEELINNLKNSGLTCK